MATPNFVANGTIQPSRFVTIDSTSENAVIQASANTQELIGVSQEWSKLAPIPGASSEAADAGDPIKVYGLTDICLLQSTTAGWTAGDRLTANSSGQGVTASGTEHFGAVALTTVSGAGLGRVQVVIGANP
jgi:hypothetical protein